MTAILRHICYLLNTAEGKLSFSLPGDLTVKGFFPISYIYDSILHLFLNNCYV